MKPLTNKQRKFLEYVRDSHDSLGWGTTIHIILSADAYDVGAPGSGDPMDVVDAFEGLLAGNNSKYGKPTKYLKGYVHN